MKTAIDISVKQSISKRIYAEDVSVFLFHYIIERKKMQNLCSNKFMLSLTNASVQFFA